MILKILHMMLGINMNIAHRAGPARGIGEIGGRLGRQMTKGRLAPQKKEKEKEKSIIIFFIYY